MRSFDFLSENTRARLPEDDAVDEDHNPVEGEFDECTDSFVGNTTAYNEFKDMAAILSGFVEANPVMYNYIKTRYAKGEVECKQEFDRRRVELTTCWGCV